MGITIPNGRPNKRFMRYVRPPTKDSTPPLFPLQPATRPMRLGIDVETIPEPPDGYLRGFLTRDEIEVHLLMPQGQTEPPAPWSELLDKPILHTVNFTSVAEADRFADAVEFHITTKSEEEEGWSVARFFPVYQQFDEQTAPGDASALTLNERHLAAAYAAGAGAVQVDAIVTNRATASRTDVGDNDIVVAVTPEDTVALIGHYLRVTSNPIVNVEVSQLIGGGILTTTESTGTVVNSYLWGVTSAMPYFDVSVEHIGAAQGGPKVSEALQSVHVRLARAARAFDHMLAALSNPLDKRRADVVEAAAEAFDRELLYLSAAFDIYGRLYRTLIDPSIDMGDVRDSLDSRAFIAKHLRPQYDESLLGDVVRLQVYAWVCKHLRNHIHKGILQVVPQPRLSEPRTRLGWYEGGWVGFGVRLSRARAALSRAWADSLPENRLHGVIAGKLYTYASNARVRRWPNGIEITGKRNTSMTDTAVSAAPVLIRYAKRIDDPVSATTAAELATARLDRDDLESVLRLIWPSMAELHACFHLSQRRQAARDDAVFNELIARLDEEDDDSDG